MSVEIALVAASNTLVDLGWTNMAAISWRWTGVLLKYHQLQLQVHYYVLLITSMTRTNLKNLFYVTTSIN